MQVRTTDNFLANLAEIEGFLSAANADAAYDALLHALRQQMIPALVRHPRMGKAFMERQAESTEAQQKHTEILAKAGKTEIREVIRGDYLILYALHDEVIDLLAIRHHRQLSFDLLAFWL